MGFELSKGYFNYNGVDVMAFDDIYPEGHQSGVSIIMHGNRLATNGDLRFEPTPGQWQPVPKQIKRELEGNKIIMHLKFPDEARHMKGFNPMIYPDVEFSYAVTVRGEGGKIFVTVDLEKPMPPEFGVCFNLELFPGAFMGKPWIMDGKSGIFPHQPNSPVLKRKEHGEYNPMFADDLIAEPYAIGSSFTVCPDDDLNCFNIKGRDLKLYDGRMNHNNGWFVISADVPDGATKNAIEWVITPRVSPNWMYSPIIQTSQVGYHTKQAKVAILELDIRDAVNASPVLYKITTAGQVPISNCDFAEWGEFLRYRYMKFDFSNVCEEGLYKIVYGDSESSVFRIADDVYDRGVWQPVLEYFLPVQMCHMRVNEKYRCWHGLCHSSEVRMAPTNHLHFDGYSQGDSTLTKFKPGDIVHGINVGGWHDAGDFDIRIESQGGEIYALALAYEEFDVFLDVTAIDQSTRIVEIHQPDGKNDILQQIEHGTLSIVSAYYALGRFYRGIIGSSLRQYVLLGDSAAADDEQWVFTENNPARELRAVAHLAAASRALSGFNDELSAKALKAACEVYEITVIGNEPSEKIAKIHGAVELFLTTHDKKYAEFLFSETEFIIAEFNQIGWIIARMFNLAENDDLNKAHLRCAKVRWCESLFLCSKLNFLAYKKAVRDALPALKEKFAAECAETPYGVPYRPQIWGAGWGIQRLGFEYYFLHKAFPEVFSADIIFSALNFILGCHPGSNTASFASGVGTKSATVGYGLNRADWSYIPGGVVSGTALIRPDFPELLEFPYLWQQVEYVLGGGSSHFMFLVLAAQKILA
ncbi:MAG: glycoside hydrolase family 9 protein [Defluviitaleaceae bacterium]|nr:glycoside hydrolase family 9 protein [Defluviitaleaceae bacterium]